MKTKNKQLEPITENQTVNDQPKSTETFFDRLKKEESELSDKCEKLASFIRSENFNNVETEQRRLLKLQYGHMNEYLGVLSQRIKLLS